MSVLLAFSLWLQTPPTDPTKAHLEASPRHQEWVDVKHDARTVHTYVVYPEAKTKAAAVLLIHENKGLTDWVRSVADQLAEAGYIALAPDLLSGAGPSGGNTEAFASVDAATKGIYALDAQQVLADLDAVAEHARKLPSCNGKLSVAGFCWGGGKSFEYATHAKELTAAYVFYGPPPPDEALDSIACPVYGFYGEKDARITSSVDATKTAMSAVGKTYEPVIYAGAGHGFMRTGETGEGSPEDRKAREDAWTRWKKLLGG